MNNTFVIGDIHGGLKALHQVLKRASIAQKDTLIFLGDYVDGWSQSPEVLDFLIDLNTKQNCIFIKGNHDDLLLNYLKTKIYNQEWFKNGGDITIESYADVSLQTINKHIAFLETLKDFYLDDANKLFIHAGFTNVNGVNFEYFPKMFYWDRTLWETALCVDPILKKTDDLYPNRLNIYNEIYIGHTPTTRLNSTKPLNKHCVWNIDTGAAFTGPLTILNIETKEFWQSDNLVDLYPLEKGRN